MTMDNHHEPAFAGQTLEGFHTGLTKLEYISAMCLQSHIANARDPATNMAYHEGAKGEGMKVSEYLATVSIGNAKLLLRLLANQDKKE